MAGPFEEPTDEEEAQRLERFLEEGAAVAREVVASVPAEEGVNAPLERPVAIEFDVSPRDLLAEVEAGEHRQVWLELDVAELVEPALALLVFVNNEEADARTPREDPSAVGGVAFFCHAQEGQDGALCLLPGEDVFTFRLDVTDALRATADAERVRANLVLVPAGEGRRLAQRELAVTDARLEVVDNFVRLAS